MLPYGILPDMLRTCALALVVLALAGCGSTAGEEDEGKARFDISVRQERGLWIASTPACGGHTASARIQADALRAVSAETIDCLNG